jgi:hypothetical protein
MRPSVFGVEVNLVYPRAFFALSPFGPDYQHQLFSEVEVVWYSVLLERFPVSARRLFDFSFCGVWFFVGLYS